MAGVPPQPFDCFNQSGSKIEEKHYTYDYLSVFSLPWRSVFTKSLASLKWLHSCESYSSFSLFFFFFFLILKEKEGLEGKAASGFP